MANLNRRTATPRTVPQQPWPQRLRSGLMSYLPLLLMALLAAATWWLVRNAPQAGGAGSGRPLRHVPDYTMQRFTLQRFGPQGELRGQIEGQELRHFPDTDTFEIEGVRVLAHGEDGSVTVATARQALSDGRGQDVQLLGDAHVTREGGKTRQPLEFRGEQLRLRLDLDRVQSDRPVQLTQGRSVFNAAGLDYDHRTGQALLQGPMQGRLDPPGRRR